MRFSYVYFVLDYTIMWNGMALREGTIPPWRKREYRVRRDRAILLRLDKIGNRRMAIVYGVST